MALICLLPKIREMKHLFIYFKTILFIFHELCIFCLFFCCVFVLTDLWEFHRIIKCIFTEFLSFVLYCDGCCLLTLFVLPDKILFKFNCIAILTIVMTSSLCLIFYLYQFLLLLRFMFFNYKFHLEFFCIRN